MMLSEKNPFSFQEAVAPKYPRPRLFFWTAPGKGRKKDRKSGLGLAGHVLKTLCLAAVLAVVFSLSPGVVQGSGASAAGQDIEGWLERIAAQYEAAITKADSRLARAETSITRCRGILVRAKASGNTKVEARASKALADAEGLRKKALADKVAAQKALSAVRGRMAGSGPTESEGGIIAVRRDADNLSGGRWGEADDPLGSLELGDSISTGSGGGVDLYLRDDDGTESQVRVGASSRLQVQQGSREKAPATLLLEQGEIHVTDQAEGPDAEIARKKRRSAVDAFLACLKQSEYIKCWELFLKRQSLRFEVRTPSWAMAVRGTEYILRYDQSSGTTTLLVLEGEVALCNDTHCQALLVQAGQGARADQNGVSLIPEPINVKAEKLRWEEWQ
jgi:hypothetical protein